MRPDPHPLKNKGVGLGNLRDFGETRAMHTIGRERITNSRPGVAARAPRQQRHRPPGLPLRTRLCHICRRSDVDRIDIALANGCRPRHLPEAITYQSRQRHERHHLWGWMLDLGAPSVIRDAAQLAMFELLRALHQEQELLEGVGSWRVPALMRRQIARTGAVMRLIRIDEWAQAQARQVGHCLVCTYAGTSIERPPLARALALADGRHCECGRRQQAA